MRVEVCAAVVERDGSLLLRRRPAGSHLAGAWEFPGGKRRPGERGRACAERETREETGLRVRAGREIARVDHDYADRRVRLRFFAAVPAGGRLRRSPSLRWVAPGALARLRVPEANRGLVARLIAEAASPRRRPPRGASARARRGRGTPRPPPKAR